MKKVFVFMVLIVVTQIVLGSQKIQALGLKVAPLLYQEKLAEGEKKKGFVDISNPNDQEVVITTEIQAFRQINENGDLEFYNKAEYTEGVRFDYEEFRLKSREAIRLYFLLDANKLPKGGVYVTLLFRTTDSGVNPDNTSIQPVTRVGTHLIIENGGGGVKNSFLKELKVPFFQFSKSLTAAATVSNSGGEKSLAFFPQVSIASAPFGPKASFKAPLVFPGNSRHVTLELPANHFGLVRLEAKTGGKKVYAWTFAATGLGRWLGPLFLIFIFGAVYLSVKYRKYLIKLKIFKKRHAGSD